MSISTCSVVLLLVVLGSLVNFAVSVSKPGMEHRDPLTVRIRQNEGETNPAPTTDDKIVHSLPQEQVVSPEVPELLQEVASVDSPEPPVDPQPAKDWRALADEAARTSVAEYFRQEEIRESNWQRSHSIMFQPTGEIAGKDAEPVLSGIRFIQRSRVIGLGINVGSCFIGIPVAGVPVEDRSVAITVFVCG